MSLKFECHSNLNVTQIGMSLKYEFHSNWNLTQIGMSLKFKCQLKGNRAFADLRCGKEDSISPSTLIVAAAKG